MAFKGLSGTDNGKLAIVAIFKNEAPYLREWLDFHFFAGTDHFLLYNNGSDDDGTAVIDSHPQSASITTIPWITFIERLNVQRLAYQHAVVNFGEHFQWMAFIDIDEFLFAPDARSVKDVLLEFDDFAVVAVPRFDFGMHGHSKKPDKPVTESYRKASFWRVRDSYKSIVRPTRISAVRTHIFKSDQKTVRISAADTSLRINHYFSKSAEEFARKLKRGWPQGSAQEKDTKLAQLERIERLGEIDDSIYPMLRAFAESADKKQ